MKKLRALQGGYPRQQDYLLTVQEELFAMANGLFAKLGVDMVLQGCDITDNLNGTVNISAGIVYVGAEVIRFDGANNVIADGSKTFVKDAAVNTNPLTFADGQPREVYTEVKAIIGNKTSITEIAVTINTLYNLATYIQDVVSSYALKGEIKDLYITDANFINDNFDNSGLGITARFSNWALANGNNGTPDLKGRVRVSIGSVTNPATGEQITFNMGDSGGETKHKLTVVELPKFKPRFRHGKSKRGTTGSEELLDKFQNNFTTEGDEIGGDQEHNNMQPYFTVITIYKIA